MSIKPPMLWGRFPSNWVKEKQLMKFPAGLGGKATAALKIYLALGMYSSYSANQEFPYPGSARLSYNELGELIGYSRSYVSIGLQMLQHRNRIVIEQPGKSQILRFPDFDPERHWVKIPAKHLYEQPYEATHRRLASLPSRGPSTLNALKLYLTLLTFRNNTSRHSLLSFDNITIYTGIPRKKIRRAVDCLSNYGLCHVDGHPGGKHGKNSPNRYFIVGITPSKPRPSATHSLLDELDDVSSSDPASAFV